MSKNPLPKNNRYQSDRFPIGMQVLAIDENIVSLTYLVTLLRKCQYEVTSTTKAAEALELLRQEKEKFDIVITDVVRLDMDGFKLSEIISFEMDIPVIMVSTNDDRANIMRGIRNGAQDFLVKPVRLQEMMNIWQHVVRRNLSTPERSFKINKGKTEQNPMPFEEEKAIKTREEEEAMQSDFNLCGTSKKPRLNWSSELHAKFLKAVQQLGGEQESKPIQILKVMNVPELTRENVASHLQKYRIMLRKNNGITSAQANSTGGVGPSRTISIPNIDTCNETSSASLLSKSKQQISSCPSTFSPNQQINYQAEISMNPNLRMSGHQIHQSIMHRHGQRSPYATPLRMENHFPTQDLKFSSSFHPGVNLQNVSHPGIVSHFSSTNNGSGARDDHQVGTYNYEAYFKYLPQVMLRENSNRPENAISQHASRSPYVSNPCQIEAPLIMGSEGDDETDQIGIQLVDQFLFALPCDDDFKG